MKKKASMQHTERELWKKKMCLLTFFFLICVCFSFSLTHCECVSEWVCVCVFQREKDSILLVFSILLFAFKFACVCVFPEFIFFHLKCANDVCFFHHQQQSNVSFQAASSHVLRVCVCVCRSCMAASVTASKQHTKCTFKKMQCVLTAAGCDAAAAIFLQNIWPARKKAQSPLFFLQFYCISFALKRMNKLN